MHFLFFLFGYAAKSFRLTMLKFVPRGGEVAGESCSCDRLPGPTPPFRGCGE